MMDQARSLAAMDYRREIRHMELSDSLQALLLRKQRALRVNEFLKRLAQDESLVGDAQERPSMAEWLHEAEYPIKQEMVYDYGSRKFIPTHNKPVINLAELVTLILEKQGSRYTAEDLIDHVLAGGTIDQFSKKVFTK
ncbi:hypothetical protein PA598K_04798 [Paenibacillus sp. 598K]|uniref:hypothetical protein n=1 Tax=Paenibacillus sp. 598K TaxID=1117987 RepID=UPI000FFA30F4|nr:hypothetical protein [Paenibacillus sp. 598K]GBF76336.1 hypothetical protein PA598K_04798 [Paenibacillus sp. 598K]